ncbi:hypothetical protein GALL_545630 [mine drainage metagenome]|uniref:Uncharacterized protein n=1 Tax=mine drainage metagenome TaxID=410659 RepID=A0A1J5NYL9_9ZZZZ
MDSLAPAHGLSPEAGDPPSRLPHPMGGEVASVRKGRPVRGLRLGLHREEHRAIGTGGGGLAQTTIAVGLLAQRLVLRPAQEVEIDEPDRTPSPARGEEGEFTGHGRCALAPARGDDLDHPRTASRRRAKRRPELGHLGVQVHHLSNRRAHKALKLLQTALRRTGALRRDPCKATTES